MSSEKSLYRNKDFEKKLSALKSKPKRAMFNQIMNKLTLLSYLVGIEARTFIENGNPIFREMYKGYFSETDPNAVLALYEEKREPYSRKIKKMLNAEMKILMTLPGKGRAHIDSYKDALKKITEQKNKGFALDILRRDFKMDAIMKLLSQQMWKNILRREKEGIPQTATKLQLRNYLQGNVTQENSTLVERLLAEANTQLELLKLPSCFSEHKKTMIEAVRETARFLTGDTTETALKKIAIAKENVKDLKEGLSELRQNSDLAYYQNKLNRLFERNSEFTVDNIENSIINPDKKLDKDTMSQIDFNGTSSNGLTLDKEGKLVLQGQDPAVIAKRKEEEGKLFDELRKLSSVETPREEEEEHKRFVDYGWKDLKRCEDIKKALESGQPMDDDLVYRKILRKNEQYRKLREEATGEPINPALLKPVKSTTEEVQPIIMRDDGKITSIKRRIRRSPKFKK